MFSNQKPQVVDEGLKQGLEYAKQDPKLAKIYQIANVITRAILKNNLFSCSLYASILLSEALKKLGVEHDIVFGYVNYYPIQFYNPPLGMMTISPRSIGTIWVHLKEDIIVDPTRFSNVILGRIVRQTPVDYSSAPKFSLVKQATEDDVKHALNVYAAGKEDIWKLLTNPDEDRIRQEVRQMVDDVHQKLSTL